MHQLSHTYVILSAYQVMIKGLEGYWKRTKDTLLPSSPFIFSSVLSFHLMVAAAVWRNLARHAAACQRVKCNLRSHVERKRNVSPLPRSSSSHLPIHSAPLCVETVQTRRSRPVNWTRGSQLVLDTQLVLSHLFTSFHSSRIHSVVFKF